MNARERLLDAVSFTEAANWGTTPNALLNAYRAEVLRDAAEHATVTARQLDGDSEADQMAAAVAAGIARRLRTWADDAESGEGR
ncbi:hypothetical protein [Streptomyces sp. SBT349]|uniref:hypothetical protein n=1 Tax=Streptomyces sp. SBT349 TaxID=1580539 RepID=UPI00066D027E|nr:hypothetical protein [Streptomyces sp. SBT349]